MPQDQGIVIYEIYPNGCLNGVSSDTNRFAENRIYNEILRKYVKEDNGELDGNYLCAYMDVKDRIIKGSVKIASEEGRIFIDWFDEGGIKRFEGFGWKTKENQLVITYKNV